MMTVAASAEHSAAPPTTASANETHPVGGIMPASAGMVAIDSRAAEAAPSYRRAHRQIDVYT